MGRVFGLHAVLGKNQPSTEPVSSANAVEGSLCTFADIGERVGLKGFECRDCCFGPEFSQHFTPANPDQYCRVVKAGNECSRTRRVADPAQCRNGSSTDFWFCISKAGKDEGKRGRIVKPAQSLKDCNPDARVQVSECCTQRCNGDRVL